MAADGDAGVWLLRRTSGQATRSLLRLWTLPSDDGVLRKIIADAGHDVPQTRTRTRTWLSMLRAQSRLEVCDAS